MESFMTLRSAKELLGYKVVALEDKAGYVDDIYFDDRIWVIRCVVVDLGHVHPARKVVISPQVLGPPDWETELLPVKLSLNQMVQTSEVDPINVVDRQSRVDLLKPYKWMMESGDSHLRSLADVLGYRVQATDGEGGHMADFILDDRSWIIRYAVVETRDPWPAKQVALIPQWIKTIQRADSKICVSLSQRTIENCPEYFASFYTKQPYAVRFYQYQNQQSHTALAPTKQNSDAVYL
jgi:hypothetical protein